MAKTESYETAGLQDVDGIGPKVAATMAGMNLSCVHDLLHHYPHRYLDLGTIKEIGGLKEGDEGTVVGQVKEVRTRAGRRGRVSILTVTVFDGTGYVEAVWFNQNYIAAKLPEDARVALSGKVVWRYGKLQMQGPYYDVMSEAGELESLNTGRIIAVHPATAKLSAARIRKFIMSALDQYGAAIKDPLPADLMRKHQLPALPEAVRQIHFPENREALMAARKRLIFDELFYLQLGLAVRRKWLTESLRGISHHVDERLLKRFYGDLPWDLTRDQSRAVDEIKNDLEAARPMHRLLLGEVGSGKTVVAAAAMLMVAESGYQAAIMAPTEILAEQHHMKLRESFERLGLRSLLVLGGQKAAAKREALEAIANGSADIVIGTHSLIQEGVDFDRLGLVIVDEQHRFGVEQRLALRGKGASPDMLVLTATPIPRTLALTLYGDLDISTLKVRPGGRSLESQVKTTFLPEAKRERAYELIRREAREGRRAYIVCPLVDESDKLAVKSVMQEADHLKDRVFSDLRVGLLHGRMPSSEKEGVMRSFRSGGLDVLISTTVIEVGVDVPEATVILIEHAERFGLSQLHQLRGRVGRGQWASHCVLFADLKTDEAKARIEAITSITDGFVLAEADLEIRGEGQLLGSRQSGLPDLKLAKVTKHMSVLEVARKEAFAVVDADPRLRTAGNLQLRAELKRRFSGGLDWLMSG